VTSTTRRIDPLLGTALGLLLAAVLFAAFAGWSFASAPRPPADAQVRDQALRAGEQAVLNLSTLDYRHAAAGLRLWERSSTGALHTQIVSGQAAFVREFTQAKTTTTARVLDGALTSLNVRTGTAGIVVAVQIIVTPSHGQADVKQSRLEGGLRLTPSGWKLSSLTEVPVQAASGGQ
jgi:Mce-associated membrane protein